MVHGSSASAQIMTVGNRRRDVSLGQESNLGQAPVQREVTGHGSGKCTARSMRGVRTLPLRLEHFLLNSTFAGKAQEINSLVEMATGDNHGRSSHLMQFRRGQLHL